ncbi:MAG: TatD family hydrolase [bacterium]|nr:TatD family hydrolase [bacterium]
MIIDTHCHLNFNAFKDDVDKVIQRSLANEVWMINVGSQLETSEKAIELTEKYPQGVFAAIGLHPIHVLGTADLIKNKLDPEEAAAQETVKGFDIEDYRKLAASSKKVVAIGEIGLDYYWKPKSKTKLEIFKNLQKQGLSSQMDLAKELNLPTIFHCRSAHDDLIEILNTRYKIQDTKLRGVMHCFTGTVEQMRQYLALGLSLGFNGIIFKQIAGINWQEIIKAAPLDRILVETDAPYLIPPNSSVVQREGQCGSANLRNEPLFVKQVVREIAKIKKLSYQEIEEQTTKNARELFSI